MIGRNDLKQVIQRLVAYNSDLGSNDIDQLINVRTHLARIHVHLFPFFNAAVVWYSLQNILEEADLDDDGALSFAEFEHIIDKSSDFIKWA